MDTSNAYPSKYNAQGIRDGPKISDFENVAGVKCMEMWVETKRESKENWTNYNSLTLFSTIFYNLAVPTLGI